MSVSVLVLGELRRLLGSNFFRPRTTCSPEVGAGVDDVSVVSVAAGCDDVGVSVEAGCDVSVDGGADDPVLRVRDVSLAFFVITISPFKSHFLAFLQGAHTPPYALRRLVVGVGPTRVGRAPPRPSWLPRRGARTHARPVLRRTHLPRQSS